MKRGIPHFINRSGKEIRKYKAVFTSRNLNYDSYCDIWAESLETAWEIGEIEFSDFMYRVSEAELSDIDLDTANDEYEKGELLARKQRLRKEFYDTCKMAIVEE